MKKIVVKLIQLYQNTLSPDHGIFKAYFHPGFCRFYPTCSQYTKLAIDKYGIIKGGWKGLKRIARCNPWNNGGEDLP